MKFAIALRKTIVLDIDADDEVAARQEALSRSDPDGDWDRANPEVVWIDPKDAPWQITPRRSS